MQVLELVQYYCKGVEKLLLEMIELKKQISRRPRRVWIAPVNDAVIPFPYFH